MSVFRQEQESVFRVGPQSSRCACFEQGCWELKPWMNTKQRGGVTQVGSQRHWRQLMARCGGVRLIANPPGPVAQMWLSGSCVGLLGSTVYLHSPQAVFLSLTLAILF